MQLADPSKLGTKCHWDDVYKREVENFDEDGDEGEIWFGQGAVDKMVEWAQEHVPLDAGPAILDIGTGNGILPIELAEAGYQASRIYGLDYSQASIELAEKVAEGREIQGLTFRTVDFIGSDVEKINDALFRSPKDSEVGWDLLLDKGTFDAISLSDAPSEGGHAIDIYPVRVEELLKPGAYFLITSCNFTEEELIQHFTKNTSLQYHSRVQHPSFAFGGKIGTTYATVAFQKPETL